MHVANIADATQFDSSTITYDIDFISLDYLKIIKSDGGITE